MSSSASRRARGQSRRDRGTAIPWRAVVWLLAVSCCGWWYYEAQQAYDNYLLGYNDFGHFGWRVANTWEGRGFLLETPSLPAFWDHFNPGLALLAPLWGLWPDPRLFLLIQAICLALPSPAVYGIARRLGATLGRGCRLGRRLPGVSRRGATQPELQLRLASGESGFAADLPGDLGPASGRRTLAMVAAILACSFQEDVIAVLCCLASAFAFQAWLGRAPGDCPNFRVSENGTVPLPSAPASPSAGRCVAGLGVGRRGGGSRGWRLSSSSTSRRLQSFSRAGSRFGQFRPRNSAFAHFAAGRLLGRILRPRCGYFLLCLVIPLGARSLLARMADASGRRRAVRRLVGLESSAGHEHCVPIHDRFDSHSLPGGDGRGREGTSPIFAGAAA